MSRIFLSHQHDDTLQAVALKQFLQDQRPELANEIFLDVHDIRLDDKWKDRLLQKISSCEVVICLLSEKWENSTECTAEFRTAENLHKRIFCARLEPETGKGITRDYQWVDLFPADADDPQDEISFEFDNKPRTVSFPIKGLERLRDEIIERGIGANTFVWPPRNDPARAPYRGWEPLQEVDAAVFFGRDAQLVRGLEALRGMHQSGKTLFVILGPSGAGKSSFLRAGLMPRLRRENRSFVVLEIVRPGRNVLTGDNGLAKSIRDTFDRFNVKRTWQEMKDVCLNDPDRVGKLLYELHQTAADRLVDLPEGAPPPTLVLPVDQAEELFSRDAGDEAAKFLAMIGRHAGTEVASRVPLIVAMTIRTDHHEALQTAEHLREVKTELFGDLKPMPQAEFKEVIEGPARRATESGRLLTIEHALVERLLDDCVDGADTLPLLSLTLSRLYTEFGDDGDLRLDEYETMGELRKIVQTEVKSLLSTDEAKLKDDLKVLREAFIPKLATINPDNDLPVRRVTTWSELPPAARPLLDGFVAKRLLVTGAGGDNVEVALESLLTHWEELKGWLEEERDNLKQAEILKRNAAAWEKSGRNKDFLLTGQRVADAEGLLASHLKDDLAGAREFVEASRKHEDVASRRKKTMRALIAGAVVFALVAALAVSRVYDSYRQEQGGRLVIEAEQMLGGSRPGGDVLALQNLLAAQGLEASTAQAVANARRDVIRIMENPLTGDRVTPVHDVAVSPDGEGIASASDDHKVRIWDRESGAETRTLAVGDDDRPLSVAYGPDPQPDDLIGPGKPAPADISGELRHLMAAGTEKGLLEVWDVRSGDPFGTPMEVGAAVDSIAFSPDATLIATGSWDGAVQLWSTKTATRLVLAPPSDIGTVRGVAFSQDGSRLVSGGDDAELQLWDTRTGQPIGQPRPMKDGTLVHSVAFGPPDVEHGTGDRVVVGLNDGTIAVFDGDSLTPVGDSFQGHPGIVNSVAFSRGGTRIVSGGSENTVRVWSAPWQPNPGDPIGRAIGEPLVGHHGGVSSVSFNPVASEIVSGGMDGSVRVWDAVIGLPIPAGQREVGTVAFRPHANEMASGGGDGTVKLWNPQTAAPAGQLGQPSQDDSHAINSLAFSSDGTRLVTGARTGPEGRDGEVRLWDLTKLPEPGRTATNPDAMAPTDSVVMSVAFSPDGSRIVSGDRNGSIRLWDGHSLTLLGQAETDNYQVWSVAFSPDGRHVVTGSGFAANRSQLNLTQVSQLNLTQVWKVDGDTIAKDGDPMEGPAGWNVNSVSYSPDGTLIAVGSNDGTIELWDAATGDRRATMSGDQNAVTSVAFAHDRNKPWLVSGAASGKVRVWDYHTHQPIDTSIEGHQSWVRGVAFRPDDKFILSGSEDGTMHLWPAPRELTDFICSKLSSNMSRAQWRESVSRWIWYSQGCRKLSEAAG